MTLRTYTRWGVGLLGAAIAAGCGQPPAATVPNENGQAPGAGVRTGAIAETPAYALLARNDDPRAKRDANVNARHTDHQRSNARHDSNNGSDRRTANGRPSGNNGHAGDWHSNNNGNSGHAGDWHSSNNSHGGDWHSNNNDGRWNDAYSNGGWYSRSDDNDRWRDNDGHRGWDHVYDRYGDWWGGSNWWSYGTGLAPWWGLGYQPTWWGTLALTPNRFVLLNGYYYPFYAYGGLFYPDYSRPYLYQNGLFIPVSDVLPVPPNSGGAVNPAYAPVVTVTPEQVQS